MSDPVATMTPAEDEPAKDTAFYKALCWRVRDPEEAVFIARTHRRRAAEARSGIPAVIEGYQDQCRAWGLEGVACRHDEIADVCERHAARLRAASCPASARDPATAHP